MPQMQDAGCEHAVLAAHAGMQQPHDKVGILLAPAVVVGIETIDAIEIGAPDRKIAGTRAAPRPLPKPSQRPERQTYQRRQPIDAATPAFHQPASKSPCFW